MRDETKLTKIAREILTSIKNLLENSQIDSRQIKSQLDDILIVLGKIRDKIIGAPPEEFPDWMLLPDHLRKTYMTVMKLGRVTAGQVAIHTQRARAVESHYLNQLKIMGYLTSERCGRHHYFKLPI